MAGVEGERELEEFLAGALAGKPEAEAEESVETGEVVHDEGPGFQPPPEDDAETPPPSPPPPKAEEPGEAEQQEGEEAEPTVAWATKRFGDDPEKWARALYEREQHISRIASEKTQAEQVARQAMEYAQQVEAQAQARASAEMPMSAAEEEWVEQAMANPAAHAYQAARQGNVALYDAVLERVAMENPRMAVQVGTAVQMALHNERAEYEASAQQNGANLQGDFTTDLNQSFQRLGVNVKQYGEAMWQKFDELGQYHPYTLAVLGGDPMQRDLAVQAVYDIVREGQTHTRRVGEDEGDRIRREGELRREAAGIVTGSPHVAPPKEDPFFGAMEAEWRRRGQWYDEET